MSSRDPEKLQEELKSIDFAGDAKLLAELRSEARETVDAQKSTLNDIDTKASKILRLNVLLIGVIVSALSIAAQSGSSTSAAPSVEPFVNLYMKLGVASLVLSTALAAMTYTASELDVGLSSTNLKNLLKADFSPQETQELLVKNYIVRINFNRSTNIRNIPLITSTIVLVVAGIVFLALGIYEVTIGSVPWWLSGSTTVVISGVVITSGVVTQTVRAIRDVAEWR